MKKGILIFALLLTGFSYSFANTTDGITKKAVASFKKDFSNANDIQWNYTNNYAVATFSLNSAIMYAYYSQDGDLVAVARNILSDKLPISQLLGLKKKFNGYWISDLFEVAFTNSSATAYFITLENADKKLVLKSSSDGGWEEYSSQTKE